MINFSIHKQLPSPLLGRAGTLVTPHGSIETPAFVTVGTKATVKALTIPQVQAVGAQVVLANTYHLYLEPGDALVKQAGGLGKFMAWPGPTMTDSGGFQVFSLGEAFGKGVSKVALGEAMPENEVTRSPQAKLAHITDDGVVFKSHLDGSTHQFTPERSMEIQWNLGADIIFAFDECTSPTASLAYQTEALQRTYQWAQRSVAHHRVLDKKNQQALLGVIQGGQVQALREQASREIGALDFDGFGIGGSFTKKDMYTAVRWVNALLPKEKIRHLLGIGEPEDLFGGIENGCDLFDCVAPTRMARTGSLHTRLGRINIRNAQFKDDFSPIDEACSCYTCTHYTRAYLAHLHRAHEMLAGTLGSIHNLSFIISLVDGIRDSIHNGTYEGYKQHFLEQYYH